MLFSTLVRGRILTAPSVLGTATFSRIGAPVITGRVVTRSFITTTQLAEPAKNATLTSERAETKPKAKHSAKPEPKSVKKTAKGVTTPAKTAKSQPKVVEKVKTAKANKKEKPQPKKVVVRPEDIPPKRPCSPYLIFFRKFIQGQAPVEKEQALERARKAAADAGRTWSALSEQEKQPFRDEFQASMTKYRQEFLEYSARVPKQVVRELNARRVAKGKPRVKLVMPSKSKPFNPYIRFMEDFRPAFYETYTGVPADRSVNAAKAGGEKWNALSKEEKAKYYEAYEQELKAWKASRGSSSS